MAIEKTLKFKFGDYVVVTEGTDYSLLKKSSSPVEMTPIYIVKGYILDEYLGDQVGNTGESHLYILENVFTKKQVTRLQRELESADKEIDKLFKQSVSYMNTLKCIRDAVKNAKSI